MLHSNGEKTAAVFLNTVTVDVIYSPRWICDPPSASSAPSLPPVNSSAPCCLSLCPPPSGGGRLGCRYLHWHGTETLDLWGKPAVSPQLPLEHLGALHSCNDNNNKKRVFLVSSVAHVHRSRYQDNRKHREIQPQGSYLFTGMIRTESKVTTREELNQETVQELK